jgi:hypothetical protein
MNPPVLMFLPFREERHRVASCNKFDTFVFFDISTSDTLILGKQNTKQRALTLT